VTADAVDMVSFTGSVPVGAKIMALAAQSIKKVVLELGASPRTSCCRARTSKQR